MKNLSGVTSSHTVEPWSSLPLNSIEVIFFDIDGTLFDQRSAHELALTEISDKYEIFKDISKEELISAFREADERALKEFNDGVPLDKIRRQRSENILSSLDLDTNFSEEFTSIFYHLYPSMDAGFKCIDDIVEKAKEEHEIGIISNGSSEVQLTKLKAINLLHHFDVLLFSEEMGYRKPDRRIFLKAANSMGTEPEKCLYVGDYYFADIFGADKVGMRTCWINHHDQKPDGPEPDIEVNDICQLLPLLDP